MFVIRGVFEILFQLLVLVSFYLNINIHIYFYNFYCICHTREYYKKREERLKLKCGGDISNRRKCLLLLHFQLDLKKADL